nr:transposase [Streptomyces kaniharaensis]
MGGTDAGKTEHHRTVIDADGAKVLSRRVPNSEPELLELPPLEATHAQHTVIPGEKTAATIRIYGTS